MKEKLDRFITSAPVQFMLSDVMYPFTFIIIFVGSFSVIISGLNYLGKLFGVQ